VGLALHRWIKQHRHLWAVSVDQGEPSVALLLFWEADHGAPYPSKTGVLVRRLMAFTKRLKEPVAADSELQSWLECRRVKRALAPGLPPTELVQWGVKIDPAVGDHFLRPWKNHLASLVRARVAEPSGDAPPCKRPKREHPAVLPQLRNRSRIGPIQEAGRSLRCTPCKPEWSVTRHKAARVAADAALVGSEPDEHAGSSSSPVVTARWGRAAQGPPT